MESQPPNPEFRNNPEKFHHVKTAFGHSCKKTFAFKLVQIKDSM